MQKPVRWRRGRAAARHLCKLLFRFEDQAETCSCCKVNSSHWLWCDIALAHSLQAHVLFVHHEANDCGREGLHRQEAL